MLKRNYKNSENNENVSPFKEKQQQQVDASPSKKYKKPTTVGEDNIKISSFNLNVLSSKSSNVTTTEISKENETKEVD